jgi:putative ABC transport system permease protein
MLRKVTGLYQALRRLYRERSTYGIPLVLNVAIPLSFVAATAAVAYQVMWQPLEIAEADSLVRIRQFHEETTPQQSRFYVDLSPDQEYATLEALVVTHSAGFQMEIDGAMQTVNVGFATTEDFCRVLGVQPILGRCLGAEDAHEQVALITSDFWKSHYQESPDAIGATIESRGRSFVIVGVLPAALPERAFYHRIIAPVSFMTGRSTGHAYGRLAAGATPQQVAEELNLLAVHASGTQVPPRIEVRTALGDLTEQFAPAFQLLLAAAFLVLGVACANAWSLGSSRGYDAVSESAVRIALGGSRGRILGLFAVDNLLLSLVGIGLALLLADWIIQLTTHSTYYAVPRLAEAYLNAAGVSVAVIAGLFVGVVVATIAMAKSVFVSAQVAFRPRSELGSRTAATGAGRPILTGRAALAAQFAMTAMLLVCCGLFVNSIARLLAVELGYDPQNVVDISVGVPGIGSGERIPQEKIAGFFQGLLGQLEATPNVQAVGLISVVEGSTAVPAASQDGISISRMTASAGYFTAMGMRTVSGDLSAMDDQADVAVVDESMATILRDRFGSEQVSLTVGIGMGTRRVAVIGVVNDVKYGELREEEERPVVYTSMPTAVAASSRLMIRGVDDSTFPMRMKERILEVSSAALVGEPQRLTDKLAGDPTLAEPVFLAKVLLGFSLLAVLLSALGVYALASLSVVRRRHELSIRQVLGATGSDVMGLIVGDYVQVVIVGTAIGIGGAMLAVPMFREFLFQIEPTDPLTIAAATVVVAALGLAAVSIPARRAARRDLMQDLQR